MCIKTMKYPEEPNALRKFVMQQRKSIPFRKRQQKFENILHTLYQMPAFREAKHILAYYGKVETGEFDTVPLLNEILRRGKSLYLPRCSIDNTIDLNIYQVWDI